MNITPDQIPPEVVEAAARAMCLHPDLIVDNHTPTCPGPAWRLYVEDARTAIAAALAAWPRMRTGPNIYGRQDAIIHLPLPTEPSND